MGGQSQGRYYDGKGDKILHEHKGKCWVAGHGKSIVNIDDEEVATIGKGKTEVLFVPSKEQKGFKLVA